MLVLWRWLFHLTQSSLFVAATAAAAIIVGKHLQHLIPYRLGVRAIFYALLALYPNTLL